MPLDIADFLQRHCLGKRIFIAYSGGVDSRVLLQLCAGLLAFKNRITAVYVHHGLQAEAEDWGRHCQEVAEGLEVGFALLRVTARAEPGQSPEEAARDARYRAFQSLLADGDALLLAQHQQDQLETVLLQLFRGSGLKGLSGMPERMVFGSGVVLRPLLNVPKRVIDEYAAAHGLQWEEDPSNQCSDFDRNFLRNEIVPLLEQRWPSLAKTVARSARHCGDAQALLEGLARQWFDAVFDNTDDSLAIDSLLGLETDKRPWVIRHWFARLGLKMPSQAFVERVFSELLAARADADPVLAGPGYCLRRYRNRLYCVRTRESENRADLRWDVRQECLQLDGHGRLCWFKSSQGILLDVWRSACVEIRFRGGGEKIRLPKRQGRHSLKKLYQEAGIPPWRRAAMPLVYLDGRLAAVGDRWISAEVFAEREQACVSLRLVEDS